MMTLDEALDCISTKVNTRADVLVRAQALRPTLTDMAKHEQVHAMLVSMLMDHPPEDAAGLFRMLVTAFQLGATIGILMEKQEMEIPNGQGT